MRVLLTGAEGQLGQALQRNLADEVIFPLSHEELDISDAARVAEQVNRHRPDLIFNTAAYNLVDAAEESGEVAFRTNAVGVLHLARAAHAMGAVLVHFSSDYVFDGRQRRPYCESDVPRPLNVYGMSKLAGEWMAQQYSEKHFVIRTCGIYGRASKSKKENFVDRMLRAARMGQPLRVVHDQILTPTSARELAERTVLLVRTGRYGLYQMTSEGQCSWYEFAQEIFRLAGLKPSLVPVSSADFSARAHRPAYSVLENRAYHATGLEDFRPWQEALAEYLREQGEQRS
jgi:dTDP-4-dehydrorhamnose reductase